MPTLRMSSGKQILTPIFKPAESDRGLCASKRASYTIKILGLRPKGVKEERKSVYLRQALTKPPRSQSILEMAGSPEVGLIMHKRCTLVLTLIFFSQSFFLLTAQNTPQPPAPS